MKRILFIVLAAIILIPAAVIGIEMAREPGSEQAGAPVANTDEQIALGRYLTLAGNCMACHTERGGKEYAGGRAIRTPFGDIYSSNITPDEETGIGKWTSDDFWRALHNGKSKDGSFLYPAFPYPSYTKVTRADSDAIFAYFKTLAPVYQANKKHDLRFPYNQRILLAGWRALYFRSGVYEPNPGQSTEWNRGAYLVQGLGHCAACHTSRDALGGTDAKADLAGGMLSMLGWHASSLTSDAQTGLGDWETRDISDFLKTGVSRRGSALGPMAEVVSGSLQHLSDTDIQSMARYLKSVPKTGSAAKPQSVRVSGDVEAILKQGAKLYEQHCVDCHQAAGEGAPPAYPPLAGNRSLAASSPVNPIRIVLNGGYAPVTEGNPRPYGMPPFGSVLNDSEVAAVVSYIRTTWGNKGDLVSPVEVGRYRGAPVE